VTFNKDSRLPDRSTSLGNAVGVLPLATWKLAALGALLLWLSQPPLRLWPLAWIALVPWIVIAWRPQVTRRDYAAVFFFSMIHWLLTMQGIRHAHPAMYAAWVALAGYLAIYPVVGLGLVRIATERAGPRSAPDPAACRENRWHMPLWLAVPVVWTGLECVRNYLLTGISAAMLGHSQVDLPLVIQVADLFGSYGVSFLVALVNAAIATVIYSRLTGQRQADAKLACGVAAVTLVATLGYGWWRLDQAASVGQPSTSTIALIGRDEPIVFEQDTQRELDIFNAYFQQSVAAAQRAAKQGLTLDAVVWPESMFTGGLPWFVADPDKALALPADFPLRESELREVVAENRKQFEYRAQQVQYALRQITGQSSGPDLIVGCSVIRYDHPPGGHSGCVHIGGDGRVADWYAKTHLVMFGEYIPLIEYLPWIQRWIPPGMGILRGERAVALPVGDVIISPNICIETAVERVTIEHVRDLIAGGSPPDLVVNVTNDGWFDRSSIVEHHLRCAQMVAVVTRRPILIAANGGPTAWIDATGRVVERLANDASETILVTAQRHGQHTIGVTWGDWPARFLALLCGSLVIVGLLRQRQHRIARRSAEATASD
jgi:apolipoprotein N-acyltransferase